MFFNNHKEKGLTIAELLVSIAILSFGLIAILRLMNFSIITSRQNKDQIIMANLAQEGLEIVRNIYDSGTQDLFGLAGDYCVDYNDAELSSCPSNNSKLKLQDGIYSYDGGNDSPYSRKINIQKEGEDIIVITSTVSRGKSSFSLKMKLWRKQTP